MRCQAPIILGGGAKSVKANRRQIHVSLKIFKHELITLINIIYVILNNESRDYLSLQWVCHQFVITGKDSTICTWLHCLSELPHEPALKQLQLLDRSTSTRLSQSVKPRHGSHNSDLISLPVCEQEAGRARANWHLFYRFTDAGTCYARRLAAQQTGAEKSTFPIKFVWTFRHCGKM